MSVFSTLTSPAPAANAVAKNPTGLASCDAAALLRGMGMAPMPAQYDRAPLPHSLAAMGEEDDEDGEVAVVGGVSRKDKSLGLLCDNFVKLFAAGDAKAVELEEVAAKLSVGRRRIYDIVNVLESLDVVQKDRASAYTWLGMSKLPECVRDLAMAKPLVPLLVDEDVPGSDAAKFEAAALEAAKGRGGRTAPAAPEGRKEKSIRELATKFVSLFLQAADHPGCDSTISLDQAARSLLKHESGVGASGPEPDAGAMKTKVRRLYDICNVLSSLKMIVKVRLPDTSKPAFKWLGVTAETAKVFDSQAAKDREVKAYGGGANLPVCSKRSRQSLDAAETKAARALKRQSTAETAVLGKYAPTAAQHPSGLPFSRLSGGIGGGAQSAGMMPRASFAHQQHFATNGAFGAYGEAGVAFHPRLAATDTPPMPMPMQRLSIGSFGGQQARALGVLSPASQQAITTSPRLPAKPESAPTPAHATAATPSGVAALLSLAAHCTPCQQVTIPEDVNAMANVVPSALSAEL